MSRQTGSPAFPLPLMSWPPRSHLSTHCPPTREKQQPAPRLTLRDLQNKSSCSSPSSSATGLHTGSPEPPGPLQQPAQTELSLASITVPLESIKPSEWGGHMSRYQRGWASPLPGSTSRLIVPSPSGALSGGAGGEVGLSSQPRPCLMKLGGGALGETPPLPSTSSSVPEWLQNWCTLLVTGKRTSDG